MVLNNLSNGWQYHEETSFSLVRWHREFNRLSFNRFGVKNRNPKVGPFVALLKYRVDWKG